MKDQTIVALTPEQLDKWKQAVRPVYDQWARSMPAGGPDAQQVLKAYQDELASRGGKL